MSNEEEEAREEKEIETLEVETVDLNAMKITKEIEIPLWMIMGLLEKGIIKLKGEIKGRNVILLIDTRAPTTSYTNG